MTRVYYYLISFHFVLNQSHHFALLQPTCYCTYVIQICFNKEINKDISELAFAIVCSRQPKTVGARRSSVVRAFAHGAMGRRTNAYSTSWGGPIELFLVPASAPRLV